MTTITSKYHEDNILNWEKGTQMPTPPTALWLALLTAMPTTNTGTGLAEVTGNNYARIQISPADWAAIVQNGDLVTDQSQTNADKTFPTPSGSWGPVVGAALYDAATLGNWLRASSMASQTFTSGSTVSVPSGNVVRQVN